MGVGKTIEILALILTNRHEGGEGKASSEMPKRSEGTSISPANSVTIVDEEVVKLTADDDQLRQMVTSTANAATTTTAVTTMPVSSGGDNSVSAVDKELTDRVDAGMAPSEHDKEEERNDCNNNESDNSENHANSDTASSSNNGSSNSVT